MYVCMRECVRVCVCVCGLVLAPAEDTVLLQVRFGFASFGYLLLDCWQKSGSLYECEVLAFCWPLRETLLPLVCRLCLLILKSTCNA